MIIAQKLENGYKNQIENIKKVKNYEIKIKLIGALVLDVGGKCINAIAKACNCSWRFVKKCYLIMKNKLKIVSNKKSVEEKRKPMNIQN